MKSIVHTLILAFALFGGAASALAGGDKEYTGQFETALVADTEDAERIVFKHVTADRVKTATPLPASAHLAATRIYSPQTGRLSVLALLVEEKGQPPQLFVDLNDDNQLAPDEKFVLRQEEEDNPYLWIATVNLSVKDSFFTVCPVFLRYFRTFKTEKMTPDDRLFMQSTDVFARGRVDADSRKILVQYAYSFETKSIDPQNGWLGVDSDENGEVDMNKLSPEAAKAAKETVVFRVGQNYFSTKKVDLKKNLIVLREHEAKDYRRFELAVGKPFPDFEFTDLTGKKRRISDYRGKYLLVDVWGLWCPPCRREMPYLREAARAFRERNLELVGLNTDDEFTPEQIKKYLDDNQMKWPQARLDSITELINFQLRIETFPTTFLISPEGQLLSMSRSERGEPDLRGEDLYKTLDGILPEK
ncbi:MAG: TlpA family protein disulfide reductase [Acidobacteria bacterium]|nr:TlpA family protein disulfide reductase [Acidobacteriota bacterium]